MQPRTFTCHGELLTLREHSYGNGNTAIEAVLSNGSHYQLTVNMPPYDTLPLGVFFVKDWSENIGIAEAFLTSGLVVAADDIADRQSGYIVASAYRWAD